MLMPFPTNSDPMSLPRSRISLRFHLDSSCHRETRRGARIKERSSRCSGVYPSGEGGDIIGKPHSERRVLQVFLESTENTSKTARRTYVQTETGEITNCRDVSDAWTVRPADTCSDVDFFFEGQALDL